MNSREDWHAWQLDYLHGLFVIWPPDGVRQVVNRLRHEYDPVSQATIEAHITLTQPFLARPGDEEWALLAQVVAGFESFEIAYGPVDTFFPGPVIYLAIQPQAKVLALRHALHETGLFNLTLPYTDDFVPHMTIAEGRSDKTVDELMLAKVRSRAQQGSFLLCDVALVKPDRHFRFEVRRRFSLSRRRQK